MIDDKGGEVVWEGLKAGASRLAGKITGKEARQRQALAAQVFAEHEAREDFALLEAIAKLEQHMPGPVVRQHLYNHARQMIEAAVMDALADGLLGPDEEQAIARLCSRYGKVEIDPASQLLLDRARIQYQAWASPLSAINSALLLKRGEWAAHAVAASAFEERQRTVRVNYSGAQARVRIAKGVYYRVGSVDLGRQQESYQHNLGHGDLVATNQRLLWVSPARTISVMLGKIVHFEPFSDGVKVARDSGKPLLFHFGHDDLAAMVRISRVIEELR